MTNQEKKLESFFKKFKNAKIKLIIPNSEYYKNGIIGYIDGVAGNLLYMRPFLNEKSFFYFSLPGFLESNSNFSNRYLDVDYLKIYNQAMYNEIMTLVLSE